MIVTGDMTQIVLPHSQQSGLVQVMNVLRDVPGIGKVEFTKRDIVRHKLVQQIVEAYEKYDLIQKENFRKEKSENGGDSRKSRIEI